MTTLDRTRLGALILEDEFSGTAINPAIWTQTFPWGVGGKDSHALTGDGSICAYDPSMVTVAGGACTLSARRTPNKWGYPWTSGLIRSVAPVPINTYTEIKAVLPKGAGLHSGLWLCGPDKATGAFGEIDIIETLGQDPCTGYCTTHYGPGERLSAEIKFRRLDTSAASINHGVMWTPGGITFYQNDALVASLPCPADLVSPMYVLANLGVGGQWAGTPDPAITESAMGLDHVRVYALK